MCCSQHTSPSVTPQHRVGTSPDIAADRVARASYISLKSVWVFCNKQVLNDVSGLKRHHCHTVCLTQALLTSTQVF